MQFNVQGGAPKAAQFVVEHGAQAVLSGNLGPNAFGVLHAAGVPSYLVPDGSVRQAVEAFRAGHVQPMGGANVEAHAGMGGSMAFGAGRGMGMGRGMGQGRGMGMGRGMAPGGSPQPAPQAPPQPKEELSQLRESLKSLQQQLAEAMDRIEQLEAEEQKVRWPGRELGRPGHYFS